MRSSSGLRQHRSTRQTWACSSAGLIWLPHRRAGLLCARGSPRLFPLAPPAPTPAAAMRARAGRVGTPLPVGNEGAGTVVAAGESAAAQALLGKVVAAAGGGMYSQYRPGHVAPCPGLPAG